MLMRAEVRGTAAGLDASRDAVFGKSTGVIGDAHHKPTAPRASSTVKALIARREPRNGSNAIEGLSGTAVADPWLGAQRQTWTGCAMFFSVCRPASSNAASSLPRT